MGRKGRQTKDLRVPERGGEELERFFVSRFLQYEVAHSLIQQNNRNICWAVSLSINVRLLFTAVSFLPMREDHDEAGILLVGILESCDVFKFTLF